MQNHKANVLSLFHKSLTYLIMKFLLFKESPQYADDINTTMAATLSYHFSQ